MKTDLLKEIEIRLHYLKTTKRLSNYRVQDYSKLRKKILKRLGKAKFSNRIVLNECKYIISTINNMTTDLSFVDQWSDDFVENYPHIPPGLFYDQKKSMYFPNEEHKNIYSKKELIKINESIKEEFKYIGNKNREYVTDSKSKLKRELKNLKELINEITFLCQKRDEVEDNHTNIFINNGFAFFEFLMQDFAKPYGKKGHHSDVIYCYFRLKECNPPMIITNKDEFLNWYCNTYLEKKGLIKNNEIVEIQGKTFEQVNDLEKRRENSYNSSLNKFLSQ